MGSESHFNTDRVMASLWLRVIASDVCKMPPEREGAKP